MTKHFVSGCCAGERCSMCGEPATHKVSEEIQGDAPMPGRHPLSAYVCCGHFHMLFGKAAPCRDACEVCQGERGGVPGNENIKDGKVMCDYCSAEAYRAKHGTHPAQDPRQAQVDAWLTENVGSGAGNVFEDYDDKASVLRVAAESVEENDTLTQGCGVGPLMGYIEAWVDRFEVGNG